jgi:3-phosphoshikimate 1-carboxyvinyltransferase
VTPRIFDLVEEMARTKPDEPAVIDVRESGDRVWSWSELWRESGRVAALLLHVGVRPGESVAYQLPNWAEFVAITVGILRAGAVCCPLMPIFREREIAYTVERAKARAIFVPQVFRGRRHAEEIAAIEAQLPTVAHAFVLGDDAALPHGGRIAWSRYADALEAARPHAGAIDACDPAPDAIAQLLFTSGTSGEPKGVLHRSDTLVRATQLEIAHLHLGAGDRIYIPSPLAHQTGFLYGMLLAFSLGEAQIVQEVWDPLRALRALREWRGTFVQAATPFLADLVKAVEDGAQAPGALRIFVATGAAVPRSLARRAGDTLKTAVCGAFGTTEGCLATLASPDDPPEKTWGTDGRPLATIRIRVRDDDGNVLPADTEGHYETNSPTMFEGYLDRPDWTAEAYTEDGWYRTGDLATIDAQGYLRITGRVKDVINRGGEKIPIAEVEQLLYAHPAVREAAIVAMPDPRLVERACLFVVTNDGSTLSFEDMQAFLDERRVAKQYWPERLEIVDELPRTASGKIQKYVLRERAKAFVPQSAERSNA